MDPGEGSAKLSTKEAAFIGAQRVAHLATADADGSPYAVPICFVHLNGSFYTAIDDKPKRPGALRRLRNITVNPRAALIFDSYNEDWTKLGWVMIRGAAAIVGDGDEHAQAVAALREKYSQYETMDLSRRQLIKVTPERVSSWGQAASE